MGSSALRSVDALLRALPADTLLRRFFAELEVVGVASTADVGSSEPVDSGSSVSQPLSSIDRESFRGGLWKPEEP